MSSVDHVCCNRKLRWNFQKALEEILLKEPCFRLKSEKHNSGASFYWFRQRDKGDRPLLFVISPISKCGDPPHYSHTKEVTGWEDGWRQRGREPTTALKERAVMKADLSRSGPVLGDLKSVRIASINTVFFKYQECERISVTFHFHTPLYFHKQCVWIIFPSRTIRKGF